MKVTLDTLRRFYLLVVVFYYFGFLSFVSRLVSGGRADDLMASNSAGNLPKQVIGLLLLIGGIFLLLKIDKRMLFKTLVNNYWWVLLIGYFLLSMGWSYEPTITLRRVIAFTTLAIAALCLVSMFEAKSLMYFIAKAIFVAAIIGLLFVLIAPGMALGGEGERANTFRGIMADKNGGARLYAYGILILVGLEKYKNYQQKFMLFVLSICLFSANSASAIVMVIGGVGLIFLFRKLHTNNTKTNLGRFILIVAVLIFAGVVINFAYEFLLMLLGRDPTLTNRQIIWELLSVYIQQEFMWGYGFGAFWASDAVLPFIERWGFIGNAHSGYYEMMLNGGLIGLIITALLTLHVVKQLVGKYITKQHGNLISALIAILILQVIVNYVGFIIMNHNSADMVIFALIAFVAASSVNNHANFNTESLMTKSKNI